MAHLSKENLKSYLDNRWDVRVESIQNDLMLDPKDLPALVRLLNEFVQEVWITKSYCKTHQSEEYDPGPAQERITSR